MNQIKKTLFLLLIGSHDKFKTEKLKLNFTERAKKIDRCKMHRWNSVAASKPKLNWKTYSFSKRYQKTCEVLANSAAAIISISDPSVVLPFNLQTLDFFSIKCNVTWIFAHKFFVLMRTLLVLQKEKINQSFHYYIFRFFMSLPCAKDSNYIFE
jgi:hypothetical protein